MKRIAILGSTGSIGVNALDIAARLKGQFTVTALSADTNIELIARQAAVFRPRTVCVGNALRATAVKRMVARGTKIICGAEGLREIAASSDVDLVVFAIAGSACLIPLLDAIEHRKEIALANKESLVSAGELVMRRAARRGVTIVPIDSEHSAIFQCLDGRRDELSRIYLTGSGGPLRTIAARRFDALPRSAILNHPKWRMGKKISVDSATMMNKGLEIIEACRLFGVDESAVEVLIHPEAIVHSMVELIDRSVLGQMSEPDMRLAIQYAMTYPGRMSGCIGRIDFCRAGALSFFPPDHRKFPCLALARAAVRAGGTAPAVLNAADEEVVQAYLAGSIRFSAIPSVIEKVLSRHRGRSGREPSLADVLGAETWAREETRVLCCH